MAHLSEVAQIIRKDDTLHQISSQPFRVTGNFNHTPQSLFSLPKYIENGPLSANDAIPIRINNNSNNSNNHHNINNNNTVPFYPFPPRSRTCDLNGAPLLIHRGLTSIRRKSTIKGAVGTGLPIANKRLSDDKDYSWIPSPYIQANFSNQYRRMGMGLDNNNNNNNKESSSSSSIQKNKSKQLSLTSPSSIHGSIPFRTASSSKGGLFDPSVRSHARNDTHDPDGLLMEWVMPGRVYHSRPFLSTSIEKSQKDYSFLSGHRQYPYKYSPYELTERTQTTTKIPTLSIGNGFRNIENNINNNNNNYNNNNSINHRPPFRPVAGPLTSRHPCETDRNPQFHSIQSKQELCAHSCNHVTQETSKIIQQHNRYYQQQQHQDGIQSAR